mmetsp:Transcript_10266/g.16773  ORF Transcript_10266/g.16773 Transcript_10266/m.16773 type:complete len:223 (-) Transcript_10266:121-789(-)
MPKDVHCDVEGAQIAQEKRQGSKSDSVPSLSPDQFKLLAAATMVIAWTISGVEFLAPTLWMGFSKDSTSVLLLTTASLWLTGCVFMVVGLLRPSLFLLTDGIASILWTLAAVAGAASLDPVAMLEGDGTTAAWLGLIAYIAWIIAAILWCLISWRCIRVTRSLEGVVILFWLLCGIFFLFGSCVDEFLTGPSRWAYVSSAMWWNFGVLPWSILFLSGGSFWL